MTDTSSLQKPVNRLKLRIAVGALFFMAGLCFASWTSEIGTIQNFLGLSKVGLGGVLAALPVGLMCSLPFSGWVISKIGSRKLLVSALTLYGISLIGLGLSQNTIQLVCCLFVFGFASNAVNISVNTQAVATEHLYGKTIMASFHGLWSLGSFTGAFVGLVMIAFGIKPFHHFVAITIVIIICIALVAQSLKDDKTADSGPLFVMPDSSLIKLGIIAFCSLICEGAMFDWSTIYFRDVVHPPKELIGAGYACFMGAMATGRFSADYVAKRVGSKRTLQISGSLTAIGLVIAVVFPHLVSVMIGFILVGFGVSSVVPMVYSAAGKSKTMSPGVALAAVSTIGFAGFLIAPPIIGFIAGLATLRASFLLIACMGLSVVIVTTRTKLD